MAITKFTLILGITFVVVGILGVVTGGHDHNLIVFGVNMSHNLVHILSGILAIAASLAGVKMSKMYCLAFGAVYGLVTIGGFLNIPQVVTLLNINMADNLLHLVITAGCLYYGLTTKGVAV